MPGPTLIAAQPPEAVLEWPLTGKVMSEYPAAEGLLVTPIESGAERSFRLSLALIHSQLRACEELVI
jgi:hypothetical protein